MKKAAGRGCLIALNSRNAADEQTVAHYAGLLIVEATTPALAAAPVKPEFGSGSDNLFWWLGYAWSEVEDSVSIGKVKRSWDQTHTVKGGVS